MSVESSNRERFERLRKHVETLERRIEAMESTTTMACELTEEREREVQAQAQAEAQTQTTQVKRKRGKRGD